MTEQVPTSLIMIQGFLSAAIAQTVTLPFDTARVALQIQGEQVVANPIDGQKNKGF